MSPGILADPAPLSVPTAGRMFLHRTDPALPAGPVFDILNVVLTRRRRHDEGRAEGEKTKALDIARNLKAMGLGMTEIQKATGLSEEEIAILSS